MSSRIEIALGLGSNLGDKLYYLQQAIFSLQQIPEIVLTKASSVYQTAPLGWANQPDFYNAVVVGYTCLAAEQLLERLQLVEQKYNRVRVVRWGPRTLDLDLLLYGQACLQTACLQVPHPRMHERAFVLVPLYEILGDIKLPGLGVTVSQLLHGVGHQEMVKLGNRLYL